MTLFLQTDIVVPPVMLASMWVPVQVLVVLFPIMLPPKAPGKAVKDGQWKIQALGCDQPSPAAIWGVN